MSGTEEYREQCQQCKKGRPYTDPVSDFQKVKMCPTCNTTTEWKLKSRPGGGTGSRRGSIAPESVITQQRTRVEPTEKKLVEVCTQCETKRPYNGLDVDWQEVSFCERCNQQTQWKLFERRPRGTGAVQPSQRGAAGASAGAVSGKEDEYTPMVADDTAKTSSSSGGFNWKYTVIGCLAGAAIGGVCGFFVGKIIFGAGAVTYGVAATAGGKATATAAATATQAAADAGGRQSTATAVATMTVAQQNGAATATALAGQESLKAAHEATVAMLDKIPVTTPIASPVTATYVEGVGIGSVAVGAAVGSVAGCAVGIPADKEANRKRLKA